ncbi:MAG: SDR family NAD(P)-dependent oxidoreductase [Pseudomonadales bacterium]|nr:SDR family NAD(P)-dependent oxidoreductase [Halioglobus sp.]MCP5130073.1 SDR family NAD(P)-dependent oxidoreductase [Pseudomonadales bacterium]
MKVVVVTGGTRGLGLAIVRKLFAENYRVVAIGRSCSEQLQALMAEAAGQVAFQAYDFSDIGGIHELALQLGRDHGRIYGLVNNAALGHDGILATMHEREISELLKINVEAPILLTKYLLRPMLINRAGRVVNVSSIMAATGFSGLAVYGATKAALGGFTRSLAREVGKAGITVNTVAPGYMQTDMTDSLQGDKLAAIKRRSPLGVLADVDDVASGVAYLLGESAARVTGTTLTIDAGSTA